MPASKFKNYVASARHLLHDCYQILEGKDLTQKWPVILRNIHTIKGNSRTYDLDDMSLLIHEVENVIFGFSADALGSLEIQETRRGLQKIETQIRAYEILHDEKLKRGNFAELEDSMLRLTAIVTDAWHQLPRQVQRDLDDIITRLDKMNVNSFTKAIKPIIHSLKPIAEQLHKKTPRVDIEGEDFYLSATQVELVEDIFVHLFRNSLDHGFDTQMAGAISIRVFHRPEGTDLVYRDDGQGLNLAVLRRKGIERGLLSEGASDLEVARTIFVPGISSAQVVTEISGRGVGMDAVQDFVTKLGGQVTIELEGPGSLPGFQRFSLRLHLGPQKLVQGSHSLAVAS
jgi:chemotaxis protein histidine kinase CheA